MFRVVNKTVAIGLLFSVGLACADSIERYMQIAQTIPNREMKADTESQVWARSARNVLNLANESIAETLHIANMTAKDSGHALFCLPPGKTLTPKALGRLIQAYYTNLTPVMLEKQQQMTVSQVALISVMQRYPCAKSTIASTNRAESFTQGIN
jgi:hypothetical protein